MWHCRSNIGRREYYAVYFVFSLLFINAASLRELYWYWLKRSFVNLFEIIINKAIERGVVMNVLIQCSTWLSLCQSRMKVALTDLSADKSSSLARNEALSARNNRFELPDNRDSLAEILPARKRARHWLKVRALDVRSHQWLLMMRS